MMHLFDYNDTPAKVMEPEVVRLLCSIHELKGRVEVREPAAPAVSASLRATARVQSTGASNRIEGIVTTVPRLKALVEGQAAPLNRSEEEIAGYRDVLAIISDHFAYIPPAPSYILQMHRDLYAYAGNGGCWKTTDNVISEQGADGQRRIRFTPVPAYRTPEAMESLCGAFRSAMAEGRHEALVLIPMFILDFLCIHPFLDGNGRMSRLLSTLLLSRSGYHVGHYVSLEQLIDHTKESYYAALQRGSQGWHDNCCDYAPFVRYFLGIVLKAYTEWERCLQRETSRQGPKGGQIRRLFAESLRPLRKSDIAALCPGISLTTIERTLRSLVEEGSIVRLNRGRATAYVRSESFAEKA